MTKLMTVFKMLMTITLLSTSFLAQAGIFNFMNHNKPDRKQDLKLFDPHRKEFTCMMQDNVVPPVDAEAEVWFQQALEAESPFKISYKRDFAGAATLYAKAAAKKHWKAQLNLANLYLEGKGVPQNTEKSIQLVEEAMAWGVPAAYDRMGSYYQEGIVPSREPATKAYVFWQKAADMGSPEAQTYLGEKLTGTWDNPPSFWANVPVGTKMLECAFAQGYGKAAVELSLIYARPKTPEARARALQTLHEGVKMGSEKSANFMYSEFNGIDLERGTNFVGFIDNARADRYSAIGDELGRRPFMTLPNLDKVLPLPPAKLPQWDGNPKSLIEAAKGLRPLPYKPKTTSNNGTGRYAIPEGHKLVPSNYPDASDMSKVPATAYWKPYAYSQNPYITNLVNQVPAGLYQAGEAFDKIPDPATGHNCGGVRWQCYVLVDNRPAQHPRIVAGLERGVEKPDNLLQCAVGEPCPATGTWRPLVMNDHPMARSINQLWRQSWFTAGATMPDLPENMGVNASDVTWQLLELDSDTV